MPGAHFNPPPGWPVPQDWTPPADWQPDPSWPPAPPGWQFFVDADSPPRQEKEPQSARPSRRRAALVAGAIAFVVTLVAGTIAAVMWFRGSENAPPWPVGMLAATYPTQPQFAWSVQATSLVQGDNPHFATPVSGVVRYTSETGAIVADDHVITHVLADMEKSGDDHLVSLRTTDGHVDWSIPVALSGCARKLLGNTLPCLKSGNHTDHSEVQFIDAGNGKTTSIGRVPFTANWVETDGHSLYTGGVDKSDTGGTNAFEFVVAKGSPDNPTTSWKVTVSQDQCATKNQDQFGDLHAAHGLVWGSNGFVGEAALHDRDGSPVFDHGVTDVMVAEDGSTVAGIRCDGTPDQDSGATEVVDSAGRSLFTSQDALQRFDIDVHTGGPTPFLTRGGDVLDPTSGDKRGHLDLPSGKMTPNVLVGNIVIGSGNDGSSGYDIGSGQQLWHLGKTRVLPGAVTDGIHLLTGNGSDGIDAVTIADGTVAWSIDSGGGTLYATDTGLLSVSDSTIGLLRPTGPPATVPSITGDENTGGSGSTRYVTKCGRTPKFVPEAIHTDSGALVIRMKIVAFCPGGDVLASPNTRITVTSTNGQNVAAGTFDLSGNPIVIPPDPGGSNSSQPAVEHEFRFPIGTFWRLPVSTNEVPANGASAHGPVDLGVKTLVVACQESGSAKTTVPSGKSGSSPPVSASTAIGPAPPASGDPESASLDGLRAIADADRPFVASHLADHWVPQLSSKRPGTVDDGITWDNAAILQGHLKLRLQYPEARLLWSGDWSTFSGRDFWVTITGVTFPGADGALAWCRDHHRDSDHCYAKLISKTHPIADSTAYNP